MSISVAIYWYVFNNETGGNRIMESFLKLVAADLYKHTKGNLAHTAVVFPNKRAGLFL